MKYTKRDNIISFILGMAIAIPICLVAREEWKNEPKEVNVNKSIEYAEPFPTAGVEDVLNREFEEKLKEKLKEKQLLGEFKITAYCPCPLCCGEWADGLTYTETIATEGRTIAVDPEVIPLGSKVEIKGEEYIAEDIGGAIKGNRIDLFFENHEDALKWGVQSLNIFLIGFTQFR